MMIATWASIAASAITAIATIALAIVAGLTIRQNRHLVEATQAQAAASKDLADKTTKIIEQNTQLIEATKKEAEAVEKQASASLESIQQNRELIETTRQEATAVVEQSRAAHQQAEAAMKLVEETQRDRELAYRPHLVIESHTPKAGTPWDTDYLVRNIGSGPALNCRMAHHEFSGDPQQHQIWNSPLFDLGAGDAAEVTNAPSSRWYDHVFAGLAIGGNLTVDACCCEDLFGNKFRFARGFEMPDPQPKFWHHDGPPPAPKWTDWYMSLNPLG